MNTHPSNSGIGPWLSAALALAPLGLLVWAVAVTSGVGFA